ncbi:MULTISPECIES: AraC family transcriptional regulator [unclassified Rathayibacter]|uniref:helix-turn-helix transcriptional regulator n=1 Tax=unclassified Rathayibacter TaxID=2609250 RepID=UPI0015E33A59|nr:MULTISPECIES: AraC family transcriptional regulator [unclassified Rathayibacter]
MPQSWSAAERRLRRLGWIPRRPLPHGAVVDAITSPRLSLSRAWLQSGEFEILPHPGRLRVLFSADGIGRVRIGDVDHRLPPGSALMTRASTVQYAAAVSPWARFEWQLRPSVLQGSGFSSIMDTVLDLPEPYWRALTGAANTVLNFDVEPSDAAFEHFEIASEHLIASAFSALLPALDREDRSAAGVLAAGTRLIERHYRDRSFTVETLAETLGVSVSHLHRAFSSAGTTPRQQIERWRAFEAQRLLDELGSRSGADLDRVAQSAGFSSRVHMQRTFRRIDDAG